MPTVRRNERTQLIGQLPSGEKRAAPTAISEGAGVHIARADTAMQVAGVADRIGRMGTEIYARMRQQQYDQANETAVQKGWNELSDWKRKRIYDAQTGALTLKGEAALPLPEAIQEEFTARTAAIEATLTTPEQKAAFARVKQQEWDNIDMTIQRHVSTELTAFRAQTFKARVDNEINEAVVAALDPKMVADHMNAAVAELHKTAPSFGMGKEQVAQAEREIRTKIHSGVIDNLLDAEKDEQAHDYFTAVRDQIDGEVVGDLQAKVEAAGKLGDTFRAADKIIAAGGTEEEQLAKAAKLPDRIREGVEQRIERNKQIKDRQTKEQEERVQRTAFDILDRGGALADVRQIPQSMWQSFDGNVRAGMMAYADKLSKKEPIDTDLGVYYSLMQQAAERPTGFAGVNLLAYKHKLSESDFKSIAHMQLAIKTDPAKKIPELDGFATNAQILKNTLGPDVELDKSAAAREMLRELDRRVNVAQSGGQKLKTSEIQEMADEIWFGLNEVVTRPGAWSNILPGGDPFFDAGRKLARDITIADVPQRERLQVQRQLSAEGVFSPTTDQIVQRWLVVQKNLGRTKAPKND